MLSTYDPTTRQKTAVLHNALDAVEVEKLNGVGDLSFALPLEDEKNRFCQPFQLVRWEDGPCYRILDSEADGDLCRYQCEHVVATLIDDVIFGSVTLDNLTTREVLQRILSYQTTAHWVLGEVAFSRRFSYNWSNENLLVALFSVPSRFDEDYRWDFDTSAYPWTIHLRALDQTLHPQYYIRREKNLLGMARTVKGRDICTRLYALGYGEGVNQLTFASLNGGRPYLDADSEAVAKYGRVTRIWEDLRFEDPQSLLDRAKVLLAGYSRPYEHYTVQVADLSRMTGETYDRAEAGKIVWCEGVRTYVTQVERHLQEVGRDRVELANAPEDIAGSIADLADRQRINAVYAQGATCLYSQAFNDNADAGHPAVIRFYVPAEARQINKVILTWSLERYRAYETGAESTQTQVRTTDGGGGSSQTSSSGGGGTTTSGPSSVTTVGQGGDVPSAQWRTTEPQEGSGTSHYHLYWDEGGSQHYHDISHNHTVTVQDHSHSVQIPSHSHQFTIPGHTHGIVYGIYEGPRASGVTLRVDGAAVPLSSGQTEIDVASYLSVDGGGKIRRGTFHTVEIVPNGMTRISATMTVQLFLQSEGGGHY